MSSVSNKHFKKPQCHKILINIFIWRCHGFTCCSVVISFNEFSTMTSRKLATVSRQNDLFSFVCFSHWFFVISFVLVKGKDKLMIYQENVFKITVDKWNYTEICQTQRALLCFHRITTEAIRTFYKGGNFKYNEFGPVNDRT